MKKFYLTEPANTGRGPLPAGSDITGLYDNERVALCLMGKAVAVEEEDAPAMQAEILADVAAEEAERTAKDAEFTALVQAIQMVQNDPEPTLEVAPEPEVTP